MPEPSRPLFSVVTVCLDAEEHIAQALDSVAEQPFEDYEYLVVDGASTDRTIDIVRAHESAFEGRMRWTSEPDKGLYDAMNKAVGEAQGRYVVFLGADDRLAPGALAAVARALEQRPRPGIICGATRVLGRSGSWDEQPTRKLRRGMAQRAPARHQSLFTAVDDVRTAGGFDPKYRIAADYDLYLRLLEAGTRELLIGDMLSEFSLGGVSSTSAMDTARDYRDVRIAHGADPAVENLVMVKSALAATVFAVWFRVAGRSGGGRS